MLDVDSSTVRLFLHVLAASVWVGGQLVLASLVPVLRRVAPEAAGTAARQFARVAWPAYAVLVATGVWNLAAVGGTADGAYRRTLVLKLAVVALSGVTALVHAQATSRRALAISGALAGLTALLALFLGVLLRS